MIIGEVNTSFRAGFYCRKTRSVAMLRLISGWELDVERGPDWLLVKVRSPHRQHRDLPPLSELLWSVLEQHFIYRLVLELDQIRATDAPVVDELLKLHDRIATHGGVMRICGLSPENRQLLAERQASDRFVPYQNRQEALPGSGLPHQPR
jgi:anti-anti-sigma regulatory factor